MTTKDLIGQTLAGKYVVTGELGAGGMGAVYRAVQMPIEREVAVKVLKSDLSEDEMAAARFEQEARAVSRLQHPNTITIFDYGKTEDGQLYLAMELLKGRPLSDVVKRDGPMLPERACRIAQQVCASLHDAHRLGIVHRDLKPDNIFLTRVGGDPDFVKVLDFGLAKMTQGDDGVNLTKTGMIFGTPKYMSPEQAQGFPIDGRSDLYALGVVLFEMLAGKPPFTAESPMQLLLRHVSEQTPTLTSVNPACGAPPALEAVIMKAMSKMPHDRFESAAEMIDALALALQAPDDVQPFLLIPEAETDPNPQLQTRLAGLGVGTVTEEAVPAMPPRSRALALAGGGLFVLAVAVTAFAIADGRKDGHVRERQTVAVDPRPDAGLDRASEVDAGLAVVSVPDASTAVRAHVKPPPPRPPPPPPKSKRVLFTIESQPRGATVSHNGEVLCEKTPCKRTFTRSKKSIKLVFALASHKKTTKVYRANRDRKVVVRLPYDDKIGTDIKDTVRVQDLK